MNTRILVFALAIVAAGCGTSDAALPGPVRLDPTLVIPVNDRVYQGFSDDVWRTEQAGSGIEVSLRFLVDEESATTIRLKMADDAGPVLLAGSVQRVWWDGKDHESTGRLSADDVTLARWDPNGIIAGLVQMGDRSIPFWVDVRQDVVAARAGGPAVTVAPGGVILLGSTVLQYTGILSDSRCPPDVTCVWEGELAVEMVVYDNPARSIQLSLPGEAAVIVAADIGVPQQTVRLVGATVGEEPVVTFLFEQAS
jgi:hypothetical protein